MPTNATQLEPALSDDFAGMMPIETRRNFFEPKERLVQWGKLVDLMSQPIWVGEQSLDETLRAEEWAGHDLADLAAALNGLPPPADPECWKAPEWRPMPWSASRGQRDPENGRYSIVVIDVPLGHSLTQVLDRLSHLRAIVHSRYLHSAGKPQWRVIVAADPPISYEEARALHRTFNRVILRDHSAPVPGGLTPDAWHHLPACPRGASPLYTAVHILGRPLDARGWLRDSSEAAPVIQLAGASDAEREVAISPVASKPIRIGDDPTRALASDPDPSTPRAPVRPHEDDGRGATEEPECAAPRSGVDARAALVALVAEHNASGDYGSIRSRYLTLNFRLNEEGAWAPAFRPRPVVPKLASAQRPEHLDVHRDQIVIDCHWLRSNGAPVFPRDVEYEPLFDPQTPFDMELAREFAEQKWSKRHRVDDALALTPFQQAQLGTLQSTEVMTRRRHALRGTGAGATRISARMSTFRRCMNRWCENDPRMRNHRDMYEALWLARELLGDDARADHLAQLATLNIGRGAAPLTAGTVRDKLRKLDRQFATMGVV